MKKLGKDIRRQDNSMLKALVFLGKWLRHVFGLLWKLGSQEDVRGEGGARQRSEGQVCM